MNIEYIYYDNADTGIHTEFDIDSCLSIPNYKMIKAITIKSTSCGPNEETIIDNVGLQHLVNVRSIHIGGCQVNNMSARWLPSNLQVLVMARTYICDIDRDIEFRRVLPHLDVVILDACNTEQVDRKLLNMKLPAYMKHVNLLDYHLTIWPSCLNTCQGIQHLNLSNNQIKSIPHSLATLLPNLRTLDLSYNRLSTVPELPQYITELFLNDNLITDLESLPSMCKKLSLANNALQSLPAELPPELLALDISNNPDIEQLPEILPLFMETLVMARCRVNRLPEILPLNLVTLLAEHNEIQSINVIWPLSIEQVNVQNNQITEIPECIATCRNLRLLNLSHNPLEKHPVANEFTFGALLNLQSLVLDNTGFTEDDIPLNNHCVITSHPAPDMENSDVESIITTQPHDNSYSVINVSEPHQPMKQLGWVNSDQITETIEKAQKMVLTFRDSIGSAITWLIDPDE